MAHTSHHTSRRYASFVFFALARVVVVSAMTYGAYVFEDMRISMVVALCLSGAYVLESIRMSAFLGNLRGTYAKIKATRICCRLTCVW